MVAIGGTCGFSLLTRFRLWGHTVASGSPVSIIKKIGIMSLCLPYDAVARLR